MGRITSSVIRKAAVGAAALSAFVGVAFPAQAQFSQSYVDTTTGTLSDTATPCNNALIRTINIPDNVSITDIDLGMIIDHNNRGDTAAALRHPDGTQVLLYFGTGGTLNDYNVRFDQSAANAVDTGAQNVDNNTAATPYQFTVRPSGANSLNVFNGKNSQGDWMFLTCDNAVNNDGTYQRSEIFLTGVFLADLALDISTPNTSPSYGSYIDITLTATHQAEPGTANSVTVDYDLPAGLSFQGAVGDGSYNSGTGIWTIGTLAPTETASITITVEVLSSGSHNSVGEIVTSSLGDPDSTPNNSAGNPAEDDTDALTLTPGSSAGTGPSGEPTLSCASPATFDWDTNAWVYDVAVLSRSYPVGGTDNTPFTFSYSGDTNRRGTGGDQAPETNTDMAGGIAPAEQSLYYWQNLQATTESVDLTIDVGVAGTGVQDLQFSIFDIDFAAGQFRDRLTIQGSLNGSAVSPVLTSGSTNSAFGSVVVGTAANDNAQAGGNVIVTFLSPVDQVIVNYANPEASAGTSNQAMALHDLDYCPRITDFGDILPTGYGTPSHRVRSGYKIGATAPDGEVATQISPNADGDDLAGADDEDPVDFSSLVAGISSSVDIDVTGSGGFLQMWIDWNGDGDFNDTVDGESEQVAVNATTPGTTGTISVSIDVPASATLSQTNARLRWSTQSGLSFTGTASDGEVEDHAFTIGGAASLVGAKTNAVYDPAAAGLYALPGNDVIYTITVGNAGAGPTDNNSVILIDRIPDEVEFWNGDIDDGGPDTFTGTDPVGFTQANGAALTFTYATDVAFSTATTAPADFAACSAIAPDSTYRDDITYICFNPKGALADGDPDPEFSVSFRARIK